MSATQIHEVDLTKVWWNHRFRTELGDIQGLTDSIKDKGLIQPITITPDFELLAGERRVTAARAAGLLTVPALIREKKDEIDAREVELIENLVRKDWTWDERAKLTAEIDRLYKEKNIDWSGRQTAKLLDRSQSSVARDLQLAATIKSFPELAQLPTADEALKVVKKIEVEAIVGELRKRQVEQVATGVGLEKGLQTMLKIADGNYNIGDVFAGLAELPNGGDVGGWTHWNIIECDPPYGIDLNDQKKSKDNITSNVHSYEEVETDAYPAFLKKLCTELYRVAGQHTWLVFWFGPTWQNLVLTELKAAGWLVDEIPCVWTKRQGQTMQPKMYFGRAYEPFYLCRKGAPAILKEGRLNVFDFPGTSGAKKYHPTERPVPLIQEILDCLGGPMSKVLVPFLGSGATLRAAYNLGMVGTGWDMNQEYKDKFMLAVEQDTKAIGNNDEEVAEDDGESDDPDDE